jgi:hypothetical protein
VQNLETLLSEFVTTTNGRLAKIEKQQANPVNTTTSRTASTEAPNFSATKAMWAYKSTSQTPLPTTSLLSTRETATSRAENLQLQFNEIRPRNSQNKIRRTDLWVHLLNTQVIFVLSDLLIL